MKRLVLILIGMVLLLSLAPLENASGASQETRNRLNEVRARQQAASQEASHQRETLEGTQNEINELIQIMYELDMQIVAELETLEIINIAVEETEARIKQAEAELVQAQMAVDEQSDLLRYRLRAMHEAGPVGFLDVLLQAESFADFFTLFEHMRAISRADQILLEGLEEVETHRQSILTNLTREQGLAFELKNYHEAQQTVLEEKMEERTVWMINLENDAEQQALLLAIYEASVAQIDAELGLVQVQYRAEVAEAERIRLEQERIERERQEAERQERLRQQQEEERLRREAELGRELTQTEELERLNTFQGQFTWPIPASRNITSGFYSRTNPVTGRLEQHRGIDVSAPAGTQIIAAADGRVTHAGWDGAFGLRIIIDHGNGYSTLYAHNSRNRVTVGQVVSAGEHIADVGTTGQSTGNHLHFEIRRNGAAIDPMLYF